MMWQRFKKANLRFWLGELVTALPFANRSLSAIPLARRNILADKRRLLRSASGIAFAVSLMLLQIGFRDAFLDSALEVIRKIDADLILTSSTKFRFDLKDSFARRQLYAARSVAGVQWVRPIYAEYMNATWKNPQDKKIYIVRVLAFDPDQPVFLFPEVHDRLTELKQPETAMFDSRSRRYNGVAPEGTRSELARREIRIVGTFELGPDFTTDGTLIVGDRTFLKLFSDHTLAEGELADVELGAVKVRPGFNVASVQQALRRALPANVAVHSKSEFIEMEIKYQNEISPAGPIFSLGTAIGFIFGMLISYQILYSDLSQLRPQFAALKAIGYGNAYLIRVVLEQAIFYAFAGFVPAWFVCIMLYKGLSEITLLPLQMSLATTLAMAISTVAMCVLSALVAVRQVLSTDPAEVF